MRHAALVLLLVLPTLAPAEEPATPATLAPVAEKTDVEGTVPADITGRWFVVTQIKLPTGAVTPAGRLLEIARGAGHLELHVRRAELPASVSAKLKETPPGAFVWVPADGDLREVAERWDELPAVPADYTSVESKLIGADAFPREFQVDQTTKGASFAISIREAFTGSQRVQSVYTVLGVREHREGRFSGTFIMTTIAVAPFPIPITLKGDFQAYRVAAAPEPPSMWRRFLDTFSGCGRT
jgi:hypothetical protein